MRFPRAGRKPSFVVALPGVPSEMKPMFAEWVQPRLSEFGAGGRIIRRARVNCFGLGESACEAILGDVTARGRDPEVGITVHEATITLRIVAEGTAAEICEEKIAATRRVIDERLGEYVFGLEDEELQDVVVRELSRTGSSVATAEGGTGGLVASLLSGTGNKAYVGGLILPGPSALREMIAPEEKVIGPRLAELLAQNASERFGATYGIGVTDPTGAHTEKWHSLSSSYISVIGEDRGRTVEINLAGDPAIARIRVAKTALNLLRLLLTHRNP